MTEKLAIIEEKWNDLQEQADRLTTIRDIAQIVILIPALPFILLSSGVERLADWYFDKQINPKLERLQEEYMDELLIQKLVDKYEFKRV